MDGNGNGHGRMHRLFKGKNGWRPPFTGFGWGGPADAPGVGTPVIGGISYRESHLAMEMLAESNLITSVGFVEVNPILDERNKTGSVAAVALTGSLFGEKLL